MGGGCDFPVGRLSAGLDHGHSGTQWQPELPFVTPDEPGHGPNIRVTCKIDGKTLTESFASPAAQRKTEREVAFDLEAIETATRTAVHQLGGKDSLYTG